jgi:hypothetical protein
MTNTAYNFTGKTYLTTLDESKRAAARAAAEAPAEAAAGAAARAAAWDAARADFNARVERAFEEMEQ